MQRRYTLSEFLKKHDSALFTVLRSNGEEIFAHPLSASQVHEGIDKKLLGCSFTKVDIENFLGTEFITVKLRY